MWRGVSSIVLLTAVVGLAGCELPPDDALARELAASRGRSLGTAIEAYHTTGGPDTDLVAREFDVVTPENAMKWAVIHPQRDVYDFTDADTIVDFAETNGQRVRGHTLVWHSQNPSWLRADLGRAELLDILREHVTTLVGRYRGRVEAWDVVNEAIDDTGQLRNTVWLEGIGTDYIEWAFRFAREADPTARLFYNDYLIERGGPKADAVHALLADLRSRDVPVDGIGYQMHALVPALMPATKDIVTEFERFTALGLDIEITELDVAIILPSDESELLDQADAYARAAMACLSVDRCRTIVTWGFTDADSWIDAHFPGFGDGLLFDRNRQPKVAYLRWRLVFWWNLHLE